MKSMSHLNSARNGKTGYFKYLTVDVPFSCDSYNTVFNKYCPPKNEEDLKSSKKPLSVNDLRPIFGKDWHISIQKNNTTRQRLIGDVTLYHRPKITTTYDNSACNR